MTHMMTTEDAAILLGTTERKLRNTCKRYSHLLPERTFAGLPVWTDEDVDAVREHQARIDAGLCWRCGTDLDAAPEEVPGE